MPTLARLPVLPRLANNKLAIKPPMGWNSYNYYSCAPNESIVLSNAQAVVDMGLRDLGYEYITIDCGWTLPNRTSNGTLTWNPDRFPRGLPFIGSSIHKLALKFGMYSDGGIQMCMTGQPAQAGSLNFEAIDARTFASWGADSLKYDNCYSDSNIGFPVTSYTPAQSPRQHYVNMQFAIQATGRHILFQICDWGIDFPSAWAPDMGNTWRIANDITPTWSSIPRILNQAVPQTDFAGPGRWLDLDMLEVGNSVLTPDEERTHFSLWSIIKSPLVIGTALNDDYTRINEESLAILSNQRVISYNQDSLGVAASFRRRWTEEGYEIWAGNLTDNRMVIALINNKNEARRLVLDLPVVGIQSAGWLVDVWGNYNATDVLTSYAADIGAHGTMLVEVGNLTLSGVYHVEDTAAEGEERLNVYYRRDDEKLLDAHDPHGHDDPKDNHGKTKGNHANPKDHKPSNDLRSIDDQRQKARNFSEIYGLTTSNHYQMTTYLYNGTILTETVSLNASNRNSLILGTPGINYINITNPPSQLYSSAEFSTSGNASLVPCLDGFCRPTSSKISWLGGPSSSNASLKIKSPSMTALGPKLARLHFCNNDIALETSWTTGTNTRNVTVTLNGGTPVRIETPLSGRSSELFSIGFGWMDSGVMDFLIDGWKPDGEDNEIIIGNVGGDAGAVSWAADFVGLEIYW